MKHIKVPSSQSVEHCLKNLKEKDRKTSEKVYTIVFLSSELWSTIHVPLFLFWFKSILKWLKIILTIRKEAVHQNNKWNVLSFTICQTSLSVTLSINRTECREDWRYFGRFLHHFDDCQKVSHSITPHSSLPNPPPLHPSSPSSPKNNFVFLFYSKTIH